MTIVCGVDFSEESLMASRVAAALAQLSRMPLLLVHASEDGEPRDEAFSALRELRERRLSRQARELGGHAVEVEVIVQGGVPDEVLLEAASRHSARLIVIGTHGHRRRRLAELGSHADRLAHDARVPVLVARDPESFEAWARRERPLQVLLGIDRSRQSQAPLQVAVDFAKLAPCDVTAAHLYWPPAEWARLGLSGFRDLHAPDAEVTRALERDLGFCAGALVDAASVELRTEPHLGSIGQHLVELAKAKNADLVVVGSRPRGALRRLWEGSVSRTVLGGAPMSAICAPAGDAATEEIHPPNHSVLVATDFSAAGGEAVQLAYEGVADGGRVHLVHVTARLGFDTFRPHDIFDGGPDRDALKRRLATLVPARAAERHAVTTVHVLDADDCADAICQAAERLGVDCIYLGSHGPPGLQRVLHGSIAAEVLERTKRRVVVVRPPAA